MNRFVRMVVVAAGVVGALPTVLPAQSPAPQQTSAAGSQKIKACSLVTKEEVKKHLPWRPQLDQFPVEEEDIGTTGSSCNYPSVFIQVMLFTQGSIDAARKISGIETVSGIGDEAYFSNSAMPDASSRTRTTLRNCSSLSLPYNFSPAHVPANNAGRPSANSQTRSREIEPRPPSQSALIRNVATPTGWNTARC